MKHKKRLFQIVVSIYLALLLLSFPAVCRAYSFNSYGVGGTTYYSGDVTGSAYNVGGTTYYNLNGQNYSSYKVGGTTYYSGSGLSGSSYNVGGTTYGNFGGTRVNSYNVGGTTYYSGDVTGSAYNVGGTTYYSGNTPGSAYGASSFQTNANPATPIFYKPLNTTTYTYSTYNYNPYTYQRYLTTFTQPAPQPQQTYGGGSEPTFTTKAAYDLWKQVHDHPAETLSSWLDQDSVTTRGIANVTSVTNLGNGNVRVTWTNVPGANRYHIFYGPSSKGYIYDTNLGNETSHDIGGLPVGQKYYFAVQAEFTDCPADNYGGHWCYSQKGTEGVILVK